MDLKFEDLGGLALASLKGGDEEDRRYEEALGREKKKKESLFFQLMNGKADLFFLLTDKPGRNGKSLMKTWTRSARDGVCLQETVWLINKSSNTLMSLSHRDINIPHEINAEEGIAEGCRSDEPTPVDGLTVIP